MSNRLDKVRHLLTERHLDATVVAKTENVAYLSGFTGSAGLLLITPTENHLVTDSRYVEQAAEQAPMFHITQAVGGSLHTQVANLCQTLGVHRLGYEGDFVTVDQFVTIKEMHAGRELISVAGAVEGFRMIKDASELDVMRQAAAIADEAFTHILGFIKAGVTERDIALEMEYKMKKLGAEGLAFDIIAASGTRSSLPHGRASDKVVQAGDLLTLDFGAIYEGYCSDMTRTVMVGEPSEKQREIYGIVLEAEKRGVAACKAGMTGAELDEVCRSYIRSKGYADYFGHGTGHGVGRFIHEGPAVSVRGDKQVLQAGMIVTIEPGIYLPGWGGVRIEDMVLVTETGCESFSHSPKELIIL
jgi:Xaa-Pro aminopeptidase